VQTNENIKRNIVRIIDESGCFRGTAFFVQKEYCVTCHHILDTSSKIYVEKDNIRRLASYDTGYSDIGKDIAVLKVKDPPVRPLECAKETFPNLSVLIEGFRPKFPSESYETIEISSHLSRVAYKISFKEGKSDKHELEVYRLSRNVRDNYDGAPVCYSFNMKVIGMFTSKSGKAYAIPIEFILNRFQLREERSTHIEADSSSLIVRGEWFSALGDHERAISIYDIILKNTHDPNYPLALRKKGSAFIELKEYDKARECYEEVIRINYNDVTAWLNKGVSYSRQRKYDEALECYKTATEIDPNDVRLWLNIGYVYVLLFKDEQALPYFDRALEIDRTYVDSWYNKGTCLSNLKRYDESIVCFRKVLELDPMDYQAEIMLKKALALSAQSHFDDAHDINLDYYIQQEESYILEFKSSMLWNNANGKCAGDNYLRLQIIKAINSFLNSDGGTVIVGVDPNKNINGLQNDFSCLDKNRRNWDGWQQRLVSYIDKHLGSLIFDRIKILPAKKNGLIISIIKVKKAAKGVFMKYHDGVGKEKVEFYIRAGNTKHGLNPEEANEYCRNHW
jgi:tetratricopeptide (TPR) repeat protein